MSWQSLLADKKQIVLPWAGGRTVTWGPRFWKIQGFLPREHGWYNFTVDGSRVAVLQTPDPVDPNPTFEEVHPVLKGYLVGDRLIPDTVSVNVDPEWLVEQTLPIHLVEPGLEYFARAVVAQQTIGLFYVRQEFPVGPENEVIAAYQDRKPEISHIPGVTPALDLAFRWLVLQRTLAEERIERRRLQREENERKRVAEEQLAEAMKNMGTAAGRRVLAQHDFKAAAKSALDLAGAELLDVRPSYTRGEMVVQYRIQARRLECVVERDTLRVVDAGVCLTEHGTGIKGDRELSLESLPGVILEAMREGKLVVWRHAPGDVQPYDDDDWDED